MPADRFTDAVAVVTGAASGIGQAVAVAFAAEGARVAVADRDAAGGAETVAQIEAAGGEAVFVACDVSDSDAVAAVIDGAVARWGRLDAVVNNAGVGGVFYGTKHALRHMVAAGRGAVVNVASVAGIAGFPGSVAYCASKHAAVGVTRAAALEVARSGVTVNAVCPGFTDTPMVDHLKAHDARLGPRLEGAMPVGRLGTVEEIAAAVLFLCGPDARFMTGLALPVDGGLTAG